jgi:hypothetical protein
MKAREKSIGIVPGFPLRYQQDLEPGQPGQ